MIYLVTQDRKLFESNKYKVINPAAALDILKPLKEVECDTETMGW